MKNKLILILLLVLNMNVYSQQYGNTFITASGSTYSEARTAATRLATSQGLVIVGQTHSRDMNGNWTVLLKLRPRY